jgi:hypothetical protein
MDCCSGAGGHSRQQQQNKQQNTQQQQQQQQQNVQQQQQQQSTQALAGELGCLSELATQPAPAVVCGCQNAVLQLSMCMQTMPWLNLLLMLHACVQGGLLSLRLRLQPYFRPEDISRELAYTAGLWDLYAPADRAAEAEVAAVEPEASESDSSSGSSSNSSSSEEVSEMWVDAARVLGKCAVKAAGAPTPAGERWPHSEAHTAVHMHSCIALSVELAVMLSSMLQVAAVAVLHNVAMYAAIGCMCAATSNMQGRSGSVLCMNCSCSLQLFALLNM